MTKEELLQELSGKISAGEITREELHARFGVEGGMNTNTEEKKMFSGFSVNRALYVLGAAIVVIGIVIFFGQIWDELGSFGRVFVTLGVGLVMALSGSVLFRSKPDDKIGSVFHAIGGLLIPGGAMVALSELDAQSISLWPAVMAYGTISLFYLFLNYVHKRVVLTLFTIANATAFLYFLLGAVLEGSYVDSGDLYAYLTMIVGVSYIILGTYFAGGWNSPLVRALYLFGSGALYAAAFSRVFDSTGWQVLYFLLLFAGLFLAIRLKSRTILVTSTVFLVIHVAYITGKYFADSLGWPISLILLGFIFIGLGYMSININRRYIKT